MFGNSKHEEIMEELATLRSIMLNLITDSIKHGAMLKSIIEKDKAKPRRKSRERLRTTGGKRITDTEKAEFVKLFDQGLSFVEISGQTGRSASAIGNYVYESKKGINND